MWQTLKGWTSEVAGVQYVVDGVADAVPAATRHTNKARSVKGTNRFLVVPPPWLMDQSCPTSLQRRHHRLLSTHHRVGTTVQRILYRFVIVIRRSFPSARWVIFTPGGDWRRLYSLRSTSATTCSTVRRAKPAATRSVRLWSSSTYPRMMGSRAS